MFAASLSAAEGASAAATAVARAAQSEALEKEAMATFKKTQAWRKATEASAELAAAREYAQRVTAGDSAPSHKIKRPVEKSEEIVREKREHRAKILVRNDPRVDQRLFYRPSRQMSTRNRRL